jgi:preprotein translocase subunit SecG
LFALFFILTICVSYFRRKNLDNDKYTINKEIRLKINDSIDVKIPYTFELKYDFKNIEIDKKEKK